MLRTPRYEGFKKVGETLSCTACGHVFASDAEVPYKTRARVQVFSDAERPKAPKVFAENETERLCRHCAHYVVNPFMQWCGQHRREVEATDTCPLFTKKTEPKKPAI